MGVHPKALISLEFDGKPTKIPLVSYMTLPLDGSTFQAVKKVFPLFRTKVKWAGTSQARLTDRLPDFFEIASCHLALLLST